MWVARASGGRAATHRRRGSPTRCVRLQGLHHRRLPERGTPLRTTTTPSRWPAHRASFARGLRTTGYGSSSGASTGGSRAGGRIPSWRGRAMTGARSHQRWPWGSRLVGAGKWRRTCSAPSVHVSRSDRPSALRAGSISSSSHWISVPTTWMSASISPSKSCPVPVLMPCMPRTSSPRGRDEGAGPGVASGRSANPLDSKFAATLDTSTRAASRGHVAHDLLGDVVVGGVPSTDVPHAAATRRTGRAARGPRLRVTRKCIGCLTGDRTHAVPSDTRLDRPRSRALPGRRGLGDGRTREPRWPSADAREAQPSTNAPHTTRTRPTPML